MIPLIYTLENTLEKEKKKENPSKNFKMIITKMIQDIDIKFHDIQNNKLYTIATYLDPRYKLKFFSEIMKEHVQSQILEILGCSRTSHNEGPFTPPSPKKSRTELPTTSSGLRSNSCIQSSLADILSVSDKED